MLEIITISDVNIVGTNGLKAGVQVWRKKINHRLSNFETLILLLTSAEWYASRQDLKTLLITKDIGGQALLTNDTENYPAFEHIGGFELMNKPERLLLKQKILEIFGTRMLSMSTNK